MGRLATVAPTRRLTNTAKTRALVDTSGLPANLRPGILTKSEIFEMETPGVAPGRNQSKSNVLGNVVGDCRDCRALLEQLFQQVHDRGPIPFTGWLGTFSSHESL
jgi:hypothetical protein